MQGKLSLVTWPGSAYYGKLIAAENVHEVPRTIDPRAVRICLWVVEVFWWVILREFNKIIVLNFYLNFKYCKMKEG